jgi:hypothetical protein
MEKKTDNISRERMDETANRLVQTVLSILPIGAAVIGLLLQQQKDGSYVVVAVVIWLSILVLIVSALLNLQVQRHPLTQGKGVNDKLFRMYKNGLLTFTTGMFLLLFSPVGFLLKAYLPDQPLLTITPAGSQFLIQAAQAGDVQHFSLGITYEGRSPRDITLAVTTDIPAACAVLSQDVNSIHLQDQDTKTLGITATLNDGCIKGKYILIVAAVDRQKIATRKIVPMIVE